MITRLAMFATLTLCTRAIVQCDSMVVILKINFTQVLLRIKMRHVYEFCRGESTLQVWSIYSIRFRSVTYHTTLAIGARGKIRAL